jgi:hypothetical protein
MVGGKERWRGVVGGKINRKNKDRIGERMIGGKKWLSSEGWSEGKDGGRKD